MGIRVRILDKRFVGLAFGYPCGATVVVPAVAYVGRLWWKRRTEGYAVQVVERYLDNCGAYIDFYKAWTTRAFRETFEAAKAFEAELHAVEVRS